MTDSEYWLEKYDTVEVLDSMKRSIEHHRCCSWPYISRWSCDVFENTRNEALPKVLHDLYMKLVHAGRIETFIALGKRFFCSLEWFEKNKDWVDWVINYKPMPKDIKT